MAGLKCRVNMLGNTKHKVGKIPNTDVSRATKYMVLRANTTAVNSNNTYLQVLQDAHHFILVALERPLQDRHDRFQKHLNRDM